MTLMEDDMDEVAGYGVELMTDQVLGIDPGFVVRLAGGRVLTARRLLVASAPGGDGLQLVE